MVTLTWSADTELEDFEIAPFTTSINNGLYRTTLIRDAKNQADTTKAVLYIHGLTDYFFQAHVAKAYRAEGFAFYAIDLHGYGRSMQPDARPNYCSSITDYYAELDVAITHIKQTGIENLVINGHSTGALISTLYANEGKQRQSINALFLNSPFFDINATGFLRILAFTFALIGKVFPYLSLNRQHPSPYSRSILKTFKGEWSYNIKFKPPKGFPTCFGWINAVVLAQRKVKQGLAIPCPILIMHSDRSIYPFKWTDDFLCADGVLNIEHMRRYGKGLGANVEVMAIKGAMHDLVLSKKPVREKIFQELFSWLKRSL